MANPQNSFGRYELMTTDKAAATEFCSGVIGWNMDRPYRAAWPT